MTVGRRGEVRVKEAQKENAVRRCGWEIRKGDAAGRYGTLVRQGGAKW